MTIRTAPMATGANALPLSTLAAMVNRKINVPISSTAYFRPAAGAAGAAGAGDTSAAVREASGGTLVSVMMSMTSTLVLATGTCRQGQRPSALPAGWTLDLPASCNTPSATTAAKADSGSPPELPVQPRGEG